MVSAPRSGSSLTGYILHSSGVFGGIMDWRKPDKWNIKGYFENYEITSIIVDYLRKNDEYQLQKRYHPVDLDSDYPEFDKVVLSILDGQGYNRSQMWFYKNTKIPFCWRLWNRYFPNAKWIIVKRDRSEIIHSFLKTPFMDAYQTEEEWNAFLDIYDYIFFDIQKNVYHSFVFNMSNVFRGDLSGIEQVYSFIGLEKQDFISCIDHKLWNNGLTVTLSESQNAG